MAAASSLHNGSTENQNYRQLHELVTGMSSAAYLQQNPARIVAKGPLVLTNGSMPPSQDNIFDPPYQRNSMNNLNGSNPAIMSQSLDADTGVLHLRVGSQSSYSDDLTPEQANAKIEDLAKENADLKGFLKENTDILKKQYEKLDEYKLRIQTTGTQHMEKFNRTKTVVQKLRNEIARIHDDLGQTRDEHDGLSAQYKSVMSECQLLKEYKSQDDYLIEELQKVKDFHEAKLAAIDEQENTMVSRVQQTGTSKRDIELENIPALFNSKLQEIAYLKEQNERLLNQMHQFKSTNNRFLELKTERDRDVKALTDDNLSLLASVQKNLSDIKALKDRNELYTRRENVILRNKHMLSKTGESSDISSSSKESGDISGEGSGPFTLRVNLQCSPASTQTLEYDERQCKHEDVAQEKSYAGLLDQMQNERSQVTELRAQVTDQEVIISKLRADQQTRESEKMRTGSAATGESDMEHQSKISDLCASIDHLKKELEEARNSHTQPESMAEHYAHDIQMLRSQVLDLIKEVHESERKLIQANDNVEHKSTIIVELEGKQAAIAAGINKQHAHEDRLINSMRMVIANLEVNLAKEKTDHHDARQQYTELRQSFSSLVTDYNELMNTIDLLHNDKKGMVPESEHKKVVDHLTVQLIGAEEAIAFRDDQVEDLKKDLMVIKGQVEEIPILKAQLDIFQSDFNAERQAREKQHEEKERILQELHSLQIQHQTLTDELETYSRNQITQMMMAHGNASRLPGAHLQLNNRRTLDYGRLPPVMSRATHPEQARVPSTGNENAISSAISLAGGTAMSVAAGAPAAQGTTGSLRHVTRTPQSQSNFYVEPPSILQHRPPDAYLPSSTPIQESQAPPLAHPVSVQAPASVYAQHLDRHAQLVHENVPQQAVPNDDDIQFFCPKCDLQCPDLDTLRIHVDECLEND